MAGDVLKWTYLLSLVAGVPALLMSWIAAPFLWKAGLVRTAQWLPAGLAVAILAVAAIVLAGIG
jgi:hypothetical protein